VLALPRDTRGGFFMSFRPAVLTVGLVLSACAPGYEAGTAPRAPAEAGVEREIETAVVAVVVRPVSSPEAFVPLVPATGADDEGECRHLPPGTTAPDESLIMLSFGDRDAPSRSVGIALSPSGRLLRYNDLRGNLRHGASEPSTRIVIEFERETAVAMNERPGLPAEATFGAPEQFLRLESLGDPRRMIDLIRRRCGSVPPGA
jgi:hypothetical protein